ncbi:hypothetical protein PV04_00542 [Phialophora macrospora]|uniref:Transcription factor domain-containing protein n=1 Tax=Phialophora macrospora TaxID=1851006 RepID=A0A0D2FV42_9EURO|nr:hypothetical protein PV04_00542 [Phialophora macrospora]
MPTLINYNQSTFRDQLKPNKRRLQELQHSAARAHAARVSYWRKKGVSLAESKSPERGHSQDDGSSNASTESAIHVKQERDGVGEPSSQHSSRASEEAKPATAAPSAIDVSYEHLYTTRGVSGSIPTTSYSASTLTTCKWQSNSETASSEEGQALEQWGKSAVLPQLTRLPVSNLFDPFNTIPIAQDAEVVAAMDHYINNWAPSQRPGLKYQTKDNPLIRDAFPAALQNVELFEATVALCLSFKAAGENFQSRMCNWSLYHKGQALSGIRNKLYSGWVDEAVILATVFLMIIDNVFLDIQAYETHLHGLRKMAKAFKAASGKELFGGSLLSFIAWAESNALLLFGDRIALHKTATDVACLEYPRQPFPSTLTIIIGTLTPGFQSLASEGRLSVEVISSLAKTTRWTRCIDPEPGKSPSGIDQAFLTNFDPRANSADLMRLCRVSSEENAVERAICKAVYIYYANLLGWTCRCSGYRRMVEELGNTLRAWDFQETWDKGLWKWLALVTANAARRGKLQQLQTEMMTGLLALGGSGQDWKSVQLETQKFLFHSKLGREWEMCWDMAHAPTG